MANKTYQDWTERISDGQQLTAVYEHRPRLLKQSDHPGVPLHHLHLPENYENPLYAQLRRRILAFFVDSLILTALSFTMTVTVHLVVIALYFIVFPVTGLQATPGKIIANIKIVNRYGNQISLLQAAGRFVLTVIFLTVFLPLIVVIGFHKRKRGLQDVLADTYVVNRNEHEEIKRFFDKH